MGKYSGYTKLWLFGPYPYHDSAFEVKATSLQDGIEIFATICETPKKYAGRVPVWKRGRNASRTEGCPDGYDIDGNRIDEPHDPAYAAFGDKEVVRIWQLVPKGTGVQHHWNNDTDGMEWGFCREILLSELARYDQWNVVVPQIAMDTFGHELVASIPADVKREILSRQEQLLLQKEELERQMRAVSGDYEALRKELSAKQELMYHMQLYRGIGREIVQLAKGDNALSGDKVHCFQQLRYMNEEVGILEDFQDIDFRRIEDFDAWLVRHLDAIFPYSKGVMVFRVRRERKDYHLEGVEGLLLQELYDQWNAQTYFLLRNGGNLYRVLADCVIHDSLFPDIRKGEEMYRAALKGKVAFDGVPFVCGMSDVVELTDDYVKTRWFDDESCHYFDPATAAAAARREAEEKRQAWCARTGVALDPDDRRWGKTRQEIYDEVFRERSEQLPLVKRWQKAKQCDDYEELVRIEGASLRYIERYPLAELERLRQEGYEIYRVNADDGEVEVVAPQAVREEQALREVQGKVQRELQELCKNQLAGLIALQNIIDTTKIFPDLARKVSVFVYDRRFRESFEFIYDDSKMLIEHNGTPVADPMDYLAQLRTTIRKGDPVLRIVEDNYSRHEWNVERKPRTVLGVSRDRRHITIDADWPGWGRRIVKRTVAAQWIIPLKGLELDILRAFVRNRAWRDAHYAKEWRLLATILKVVGQMNGGSKDKTC